jgi:hypothetical protein
LSVAGKIPHCGIDLAEGNLHPFSLKPTVTGSQVNGRVQETVAVRLWMDQDCPPEAEH